LQDTLHQYRDLLDNWIKETKDVGRVDERELIAQWLPNGEPKKLPPLEMEEANTGIELNSPKPDATIVWKKLQDSVWQVYSGPLPKMTSFEAKAERIGFMDSDPLIYEPE
ncbi:MAG: sulfatase, partial [Pricia sp.]|nr:sulfatase [Pricia sp.]